MSPRIASNIISAILNLPNTLQVQVYFHLKLIHQDPDDDKFVDCAFMSNAHFIVTQDHHYNILRDIDFPKINVIDIDSFIKELSK